MREFRVLVILQTRAGLWQDVSRACEKYFDIVRTDARAIVIDAVGPLVSIGRPDVVFLLRVRNLERGVRLAYDCTDFIAAHTSGVSNFVYSLGYSWGNEDDTNPLAFDHPIAGLIMVKYNQSASVFLGRMIIDDIHSTMVVEAPKHEANWDYWGGLSWHEGLCLIGANHYSSLFSLATTIRSDKRVSEATVIPLFPWDHSATGTAIGIAPIRVVTRTNIDRTAIGGTSIQALSLPPKLRDASCRLSLHPRPLLLEYCPKDSIEFYEYLAAINDSPLLLEHSSEFVVDHTSEIDLDAMPSAPKNPAGAMPPPVDRESLTSILSEHSVCLLKLRGVASKVRIMLGAGSIEPMIPKGLLKGIDNIETLYRAGRIPEQTLLYYVSEIQAALDERSTGIQVNPGEALEQSPRRAGGYQRLLLACERLLQGAYYHWAKENIGNHGYDTDNIMIPVIFTFFEYNEHSPPRPAPIAPEIALGQSLPLVIRLPMMKYKPWMWPIGIGVLGKFVSSFELPSTTASHGSNATTSRVDDFVGRFVTLRNYKLVLAEQLNLLRPTGQVPESPLVIDPTATYDVNSEVLRYLRDRLSDVVCRASDTFVPEDVVGIQDSLLSGRVLSNVYDSPKDFTTFLNSYLSLDGRAKASAAAMTAFVMSLNKSPLPFEVTS